jgi:type IX secretion system PorP/SprF family membrane protein
MIRYTIILSIAALLMNLPGQAQQQPLYSQFTFNKLLFNPGSAGSENTTIIKATGYEQWVGFKGAPKYHTVSLDTRIFTESKKPRRDVKKRFKLIKPGSIGAGVVVFNEKYGPLSHTGISATYSYHVKLGENRQLSFGISPVLSNLGLNSSEVILPDDEFDDLLVGNKTRRWIMDFDFGIYLLGKDYFAGYSTHRLTSATLQWGGSLEDDFQLSRQHYLMGGYRYLLSPDILLEPATLIRLPEGGKPSMDISLQATIRRDYWCGLSFKTSRTLSVFGGLQVDRYLFGYSFDYNLSTVRKYSYGSHEIMLALQLGDTSKRFRWLNNY